VKQAHEVRRLIGLTGQASVDENLTGRENLILIARLLRQPRREARQNAKSLLERFHLEDAADRPAGKYSGGMRRRLDLAASLIGRTVPPQPEPRRGLPDTDGTRSRTNTATLAWRSLVGTSTTRSS
jgi:ABC-type Na+ transport system ATPase subunit NatA